MSGKRRKVSEFSHEDLRCELLARGAAMHARVAAEVSAAGGNKGGNAELAAFSSKELADGVRATQKVIYGVDDRKDIFRLKNAAAVQNAEGVCSLFKSMRVRDNGDGTSTLHVGMFGQVNSLCPEEPFVNQPVGAFCSGLLVAPDVVATAGHCADGENVTTIRFVFGFRMIDTKTARIRIPNSDIFSGAKVVGRRLTQAASDWCLVRLDRPATGRRIVPVWRKGKVADDADLYVIWHPAGLPAKFADGAEVRTNTQKAFFTANPGTYGGNWGSPVFNAATHEVEGVLVRGENDFVPLGSCMVSAVCPTTGCRGEDCTRVSEFVDRIN